MRKLLLSALLLAAGWLAAPQGASATLFTISVRVQDAPSGGYYGNVYDYWTGVFRGAYVAPTYQQLIDTVCAAFPDAAARVDPDPLLPDLPQTEIRLPASYQTVVMSPMKVPLPGNAARATIVEADYGDAAGDIWPLYRGDVYGADGVYLDSFYGVTADDCASQIKMGYWPTAIDITYP